MTRPVYLASCNACAGYGEGGPGATTYALEVPVQGPWYCPRCRAGLIPADEFAQVGAVVSLIGQYREFRWVVLDRDGDTITIRPLGLTVIPSRQVTLDMVRPKFSWQRLEQARRSSRKAP